VILESEEFRTILAQQATLLIYPLVASQA
jgi:hypothetical protein